MRLPVAAALLFAVAMPTGAAAQVGYLHFGNMPAELHGQAVELLSAEAGEPIAAHAVIISALDLSGDGAKDIIAYARSSAFCTDKGCEPRIFLAEAGTWHSVLEPGLVRTAAVPGAFSIVNINRTGFSDILVGSTLLVFDGSLYVEEREPEATSLDKDAFGVRCSASGRIGALLNEAGAADRAGEFCNCLGSLFEQMGHPQEDLDDAGLAYEGSGSLAADDDLAAILTDYELSCRIELTVR